MQIEPQVGMNGGRASARARTTQIKEHARALGFDPIGIVAAEKLTREKTLVEEWLNRGYHGEMSWMAQDPDQRTDPRKIFPAAQSMVVVALNYYTPHQHTDAAGTGKVSRYAWGDDYHEVVGERLHKLLAWIKERWPEAEGKVCVDIQRTMDKAWAVRAGLGWMGKHTNVITPEHGSWIFIGELLLNLELEYDHKEVADQCGSCTLCIDACPTGAIVEPYLVNSYLCISHATIESRAPEIPAEIATHLEGWLYGCDICQDVCPWNHTASSSAIVEFEPRKGNINAQLSEVLELTPETYAARFRRSAMKRAKVSGLQRNARSLLNHTEV
ncbi:MAG TPA: tRNA epoxyqueuosine(34) reductase QueG, partial [Pyrinomonadaceae bacterium]|nr:tRNA epoxyqueuosine(34) reductase QueG [Pyrinomonadaceae bacterium]